jgi:hypothetical protein
MSLIATPSVRTRKPSRASTARTDLDRERPPRGSGENVIFGGADPAIMNLVPSDIEIRRNHFTKPLTWKVDDPSYAGTHWSVKNLLELKNAAGVHSLQRVRSELVGRAGRLFALAHAAKPGRDGAVVRRMDITIRQRDARRRLGDEHVRRGRTTRARRPRVVIQNNLLFGIDKTKFGGDGRGFQVITPNAPILGLKIDHNTLIIANGNAAIVAR